ncbi:MAG: pyridoxal phosphate-dependent aminotransferase [Candidatus Margulisiibacteriota bacterium]
MKLSARVQKVKPSITLAITAKAKEMKGQGLDIVGFGAGEPDFDTPDNIKQAAIKAINEGQTKYTPAGGTAELKKAVQAKFKRENNLDYGLSQIIVNCGAKHTLYNIFQAIVSDGDEVIIPAPYWVSYPDMVLLADGTPVIVETKEENNFEITVEDLKKAITPKTRAIVINSPSNPTGCVYSKDSLQKLGDYLKDKDIYIISDEIYEHLLYDKTEFFSIANTSPAVKESCIVVNGVSKAYSMTGWRIGYAAGPENVIKAINTIQSQSTSNPTSIAQAASVEALNGDQACIGKMLKEFSARRVYMVERLNAIAGISCPMPLGAFYTFPNISGLIGKSYNGTVINGSVEFSDILLKEAGVAVIPGAGFGAEGYVRLSYAISMENIKKGLDKLEAFVGKLS